MFTTGRLAQGAAWQVPIMVMTLVRPAQQTSPLAQPAELVQPPAEPLSPPLLDAPESSVVAPESSLFAGLPEDELLHPVPAARARPRREDIKRMLLVCIVKKPFVARVLNKPARSVASAS
jgi:hypothetical protein